MEELVSRRDGRSSSTRWPTRPGRRPTTRISARLRQGPGLRLHDRKSGPGHLTDLRRDRGRHPHLRERRPPLGWRLSPAGTPRTAGATSASSLTPSASLDTAFVQSAKPYVGYIYCRATTCRTHGTASRRTCRLCWPRSTDGAPTGKRHAEATPSRAVRPCGSAVAVVRRRTAGRAAAIGVDPEQVVMGTWRQAALHVDGSPTSTSVVQGSPSSGQVVGQLPAGRRSRRPRPCRRCRRRRSRRRCRRAPHGAATVAAQAGDDGGVRAVARAVAGRAARDVDRAGVAVVAGSADRHRGSRR